MHLYSNDVAVDLSVAPDTKLSQPMSYYYFLTLNLSQILEASYVRPYCFDDGFSQNQEIAAHNHIWY